MLRYGQELTDWTKHFFGVVFGQKETAWRCEAAFSKKVFIMTSLITFWELITQFSTGFVTCNKNHPKEKSLLYFKASTPQKFYFQC